MKQFILLSFILLFSAVSFAQNKEYKKDDRTQNQKDDRYNRYQSDEINQLDLIIALELSGIRIFKFLMNPFQKEYNLIINIEEYENGEKINTVMYEGDNTYSHYPDSIARALKTPNYDFIDQLLFYSKETDERAELTISTYDRIRRAMLNKKIVRARQLYQWRRFNKYDWQLNEFVPLLVYASSWSDPRAGYERFCGVVDLSLNTQLTKEFLENSPHYYIVSYKVFE